METTYDVRYPDDMVGTDRAQPASWAESTLRSTVDCIEGYARARPLSFAMWAFGIGFALGWKLKPW
jgi:hypothetical protein